MPTSTYVALQTTTLGASASSVTFGSIPATYRDLVLVFDGNNASADTFSWLYVNGATTGYTQVSMIGTGSSTNSNTPTNPSFLPINTTNRSIAIIQFMDYSATDKHKTMLIRDHESSSEVIARAMRYANTSAITSIQLLANAGSYSVGSTFSLYGIEA